jgi:predicted nucleotidyltransferase
MDKNDALIIARKYISYLKKKNMKIHNAYLFGSYAKGTFSEDSDIDIAIIFNEMADEIEMQIRLMKLRRKIDTRIEPHPYLKDELDAFHPLCKEILSKGIEISVV